MITVLAVIALSLPCTGLCGPSDTNTIRGLASWYGEAHSGLLMANGRPFNPDALTCASWFHPIGTRLTVRAVGTGRAITVTVTDRGPSRRLVREGRVIDLSRAAFARIADIRRGLLAVEIEAP